jgi:D-glycerate 3-kinase
VERHWRPLAERIAGEARHPLVVGINGAQGSGKSTLCRFLELLLDQLGLRAITLSLDDLYLTRAGRQALAQSTHPLFATRGVPGTHDVALGSDILGDLLASHAVTLPRFDKALDDRAAAGTSVEPPADVILFEGWCVGAVPQPEDELDIPVNRLEAAEDPDGAWRLAVNRRLATDYATLFTRLDLLVMLKVESFDAVRANRRLQEEKLAAVKPGGAAIMGEAALDRFLMHYERLTRWMLKEMPDRADILIPIGPDQRPRG